jgi:hypothetical protein
MAQSLQHQIVARAVELIADEANWTRGSLARTRDGSRCGWSDPEATRYCALGALGRAAAELVVSYDQSHFFAMQAARYVLAANNLAGYCLPSINDVRGHAAIVAMFRKALAS